MPETFYCEIQDVKGIGVSQNKLNQLTSTEEQPGIFNQGNFDSARRAAVSDIHLYLSPSFSKKLPFQPVPEEITTVAALITKYYLYESKSGVTDKIESMYQRQIDKLKFLAKNPRGLGYEDTPVQPDAVQFTDKKPEDRAFHPDNIPGYFP